MKWTYRIAGILGGGLCFLIGLSMGHPNATTQQVRYIQPAVPPLVVPTTTTSKPCIINGYRVETGPGERRILKCT